MPDDPKDFLPEPQVECAYCGEVMLITEANRLDEGDGYPKKHYVCDLCFEDAKHGG